MGKNGPPGRHQLWRLNILEGLPEDKSLVIALLQCLSGDHNEAIFSGYQPEDWQKLCELARVQNLLPLLFRRLVQARWISRLPIGLASDLRSSYRALLVKNLAIYHELFIVLAELNTNHIPAILLKGGYLSKYIYQDLGVRMMVDVDLLVRRSDVSQAMALLRRSGYQGGEIAPSSEQLAKFKHAPHLVKPGLVIIELHWTFVDEDSGLQINEDELWQRAEPIQLEKIEALTLSPEDFILHICIHAAYVHRFLRQVRSIVDLAETLKKENLRVDWSRIIDKANRWGAGRGVFLMLFLAREYVHAPVPAHVLDQLQPEDFTPSILEDIFCLLVQAEARTSYGVSNVMHRSLLKRAREVLRLAFPSRAVIGINYHINTRSWKVFFYYLVFWRDKWMLAWRLVKRMLFDKEETGQRFNALYNIQTWLRIPGSDARI